MKLIDPDSLNQGTEVVINTSAKTIQLAITGNLGTDGVTMQCLYSFLKEEWLSDSNLIKFAFPMVSITEEKFELVNTWNLADTTSRNLIRDAGWALKDSGGVSEEEYMNITTLGAFNATGDTAYYQQASTGSATNTVYSAEVNQAIKIYGDGSHGNFDYRDYFKIFLRVQGKTYDSYDLITQQNLSTLTYRKYALPLSNGTDLKISDSDSTITGSSPFTQVNVKYFPQAFTRRVDSTTATRNYGIVIDVGTHSGVDGTVASGGNTLTTLANGIVASSYIGGTLTIYEGSASGSYTISSATTTSVTISTTFPTSGSNLSFTLQRPSAVQATAEEIYEKVQYLLRQSTDIDSTTATVSGNTSDELLEFVGDTLKAGTISPTNPNGGGSGVLIQGFKTTDTNRLVFVDNTATERSYPFVAAGTISFNDVIQADATAKYWMFFTNANGNTYGSSSAIIVNNNSGTPISGNVASSSAITFDFDYDNNVQGGRTSGTDAAITMICIGTSGTQFATTVSTITRSTSNAVSMVGSLERNYTNP